VGDALRLQQGLVKSVLLGDVEDLRDPMPHVPFRVEYGRDGHISPDRPAVSRHVPLCEPEARTVARHKFAKQIGAYRNVVGVGQVEEAQAQQLGLGTPHQVAYGRIHP
jgi:hypothetical protein